MDAELFRQRAAVLLARAKRKRSKGAQLDQAEEFLERAIDIAVAQGTRLFGLRATVDLCRLWLGAAKRKEARQRLSTALAAFTEGFSEFDLCAARKLLDEIGNARK